MGKEQLSTGTGAAGTDRVYRAAAVVALGSAVAALVVMCAAVRVHPWSMLGILVALPAAVIAGWHVVTRRGLARVVAGLIVLVAVVAPVLHVLAHRPGALLVAMVLFGVLNGLGPLRAATGGAAAAAAGLR